MAAEKTPPGPGQPEPNPRQMAARARAEAEADERRREQTIRIVGGFVVLVIVGGLLAIGFFAGRDDGSSSAATPIPTPDANSALPAGVSADTYGVPYGTGWTSKDEAKLPTLEIWEDFQCPACAVVEDMAGDQIKALADEGVVKLMFRTATFLDNSLAADNEANGNPNSSARAASAFGCAVDAGKTGEYHTGLFEIQPADEGVGFSDQALIDLGVTVGIEGADLEAFTTCVAQGTYLSWAANSNAAFADSGATGTPAAFLNGVELGGADLVDIESLTKRIEAATAQ